MKTTNKKSKLILLAALFFWSCPGIGQNKLTDQDTFYYGIEIGGVLCGYTETSKQLVNEGDKEWLQLEDEIITEFGTVVSLRTFTNRNGRKILYLNPNYGSIYLDRSSLSYYPGNENNAQLANFIRNYIQKNTLSVDEGEDALILFIERLNDNIQNTFDSTIHQAFYVGDRYIANSTCPSTVLWVNNTEQSANENARFQEILLTDNSNLVYATPIRDSLQGFNFKYYDFQLIVPDSGVQGSSPEAYYFWMELI